MKTFEEVGEVMIAVSDTDGISWRKFDDEIKCLVNCNDLFFWGISDFEEIEFKDIELFERTERDLLQFDNYKYEEFLTLLYCARKRKMRPQGAYYEYIPSELWGMFNECGEHRESGIGNPTATPSNCEGHE